MHTRPISFSLINRLKREAKKICRPDGISHSQALDQLAQKEGYKNWSLLMHDNQPSEQVFRFIRSKEQMRHSIHRKEGLINGERMRDVKDISHRFSSPLNAVEFAVDYMDCLLTVPRYFIDGESEAYREMRNWLPYRVQPIAPLDKNEKRLLLVNRYYAPVGSTEEQPIEEAFPHLYCQLSATQLKRFERWGRYEGSFFYDRTAPWHSRHLAKAYLEQLHTLKSFFLKI